MPTLVSIDEEELKQLREDQKILRALYAGGVENWEWYDASLEDAGVFDDD